MSIFAPVGILGFVIQLIVLAHYRRRSDYTNHGAAIIAGVMWALTWFAGFMGEGIAAAHGWPTWNVLVKALALSLAVGVIIYMAALIATWRSRT